MSILNIIWQGVRGVLELILLMLSAIFMANIVLGSIELRAVLSVVPILLMLVERYVRFKIIMPIVLAGAFAFFQEALACGWRRALIDIFWLSAVDALSLNETYFLVFSVMLFILLICLNARRVYRQ